ncbi:MAG: hydantoinase/oxoprolinase family protein [Mycoplasmatales bacterium]
MSKKVRIGIDVGGTFTDAVLIDNISGEIIDKAKIATTHYDTNGVAQGIIDIVKKVMDDNNILAENVVFIAHGTTQATNALLEGDVAKVGVIGMGSGSFSRKELNITDIELAENRFLHIENEFINSENVNEKTINDAIDKLVKKGCIAFVASEEYSIDDPSNELLVIKEIEKRDFFATAGHFISELYGLKVRTKTSIVNASLIPKMLETANMTEKVVKDLGISSQLMIMRADGGVMSIDEVRKRPILTMLSGLAAGVAGALIHEKITDGVFMEVGGTSIDISVIKGGKVIVTNASIGKHKTYLKALDVRTLAIAGGSMIRVKDKKIIDVGPRSAHLADKHYECFATKDKFDKFNFKLISPIKGDPSDYLIFDTSYGSFSYTLAGASNFLGYIKSDDYAFANQEANNMAWEKLGEYLEQNPIELANQVMDIACSTIWSTVGPMIKHYELDHKFLQLVGGGGSASVTTHALAKKYKVQGKIASNAPFISTIGVALAMVREQIERSAMDPSIEDIKKIRNDVINKVIESGAKRETIAVEVEIDSQKNVLIATATGASEFSSDTQIGGNLDEDTLRNILARGYDIEAKDVKEIAKNGSFNAFIVKKIVKNFFSLIKKETNHLCVIKNDGVIINKIKDGQIKVCSKSEIKHNLDILIEENSLFSDAGKIIPKIFVFGNHQYYDYSGLVNEDQVRTMISLDLENIAEEEIIFITAEKK